MIDEKSYPHVYSMLGYMEGVSTGEILACRYIRKAVDRAYDDFDRDWNYVFDSNRAERACRILSKFKHVKGPCAGQTFRIEPWEAFIICQLFGWIVAKGPRAGFRRFRRAYLEIARGNGKSFVFSGIGLLMLFADGEEGAEIYSAAPTRDQAKIILETMQIMVRQDPILQKRFKLKVYSHHIVHTPTNSRAESLSSDSKSIDGRNISLAMLDELHLHLTRAVYDAVETGCGKRPNSLMLMITTAGAQPAGICWEQHQYFVSIIEGEYEDPTSFGLIYTVDEGEEKRWDDVEILRKANPNWGISVEPDYIQSLIAKARTSEAALGNLKRRHLNIWSDEGVGWINKDTWVLGARTGVTLDDFLNEHPGGLLYAGLDMASRRDFMAMVFIVVLEGVEAKDTKYRVFVNLYIHAEFIKEHQNKWPQLLDWRGLGFIKVNPGKVTDANQLEADLKKVAGERTLEEVAYDPYEASALAKRLEEEDGISALTEIPQTVVHLSQPAKEIEPLLLESRLEHDGNPAMAYMVGNVVVQEDRNQNIFLRKRSLDDPTCKIDGPAALITGMVRALREEDRGPSVYETQDLEVIEVVEEQERAETNQTNTPELSPSPKGENVWEDEWV